MGFEIDRSSFDAGIFTFITESGKKYLCQISRTAPNSDVYTLSFDGQGNIFSGEIFKVMRTITDGFHEYFEKFDVKKCIVYIVGKNQDEINLKTKIFTRWIAEKYDYKITKINGFTHPLSRNIVDIETNLIHIFPSTKKSSMIGIKFCFNCGIKNKEDYKFCPNCGQNLQQA